MLSILWCFSQCALISCNKGTYEGFGCVLKYLRLKKHVLSTSVGCLMHFFDFDSSEFLLTPNLDYFTPTF